VPSFREQREILALWERFPALERLEPGAGRVALTFDDGPDPDATPAVLDALDGAGARATFFMLGEQLMQNTTLGREVAVRGHEIALHGFGHARHQELTPTQARDDLARGLGAVEAATGQRPALYRPPYGRFSEHSYEACAALGLRPVYWSAWGEDWEAIGAERIAELVSRDLVDGAIVLLHDSPRYADRTSAGPTAEAVAALAQRARHAGLTFVSLGEALSTPSAAS
jgi:peptidoglycan-N-acetylglucosamine deacetylase